MGVSTFHLSNGLFQVPNEVMVCLGIRSFNKCSSDTCCMPDAVSAAQDMTLNKLYPDLMEIIFWWRVEEKMINKQVTI